MAERHGMACLYVACMTVSYSALIHTEFLSITYRAGVGNGATASRGT